MTLRAPLTLIPLLLLGVVCAAVAEVRQHRKFVPGTKITLKARQAKYFLGENILLDYGIEYTGDEILLVDSVTGLGSPDCSVIAIDADGKKAVPSTRVFQSTGQGGTSLQRGNSEATFTIPLSYYCRLEKPGKYRIRAAHNLNWTDRKTPFAEDDPRWAETTIEVVMPDVAQARKVIERMLEAKEDVKRYQEAFCTWSTNDFADFACLRYPVYLPFLERMVSDEFAGERTQLRLQAESRALLGIAHNPTPEATQTLLRLLATENKQRRKLALGALCDRLPEPKGITRQHRCNPLEGEDADVELVRQSWRDAFTGPMRQFARKALSDLDSEVFRCSGYTLEAIGIEDDMPDLVAAVNRLIPIVERTPRAEFIGETVPVRGSYLGATYAIEALAARGVPAKADPRTAGEILHFVAAMKHQKDFRPKNWEKQYRDWIRTEPTLVREYVLFNTLRPLPELLHEPSREATRKVLVATHDPPTLHAAVRSAVEFKIPLDETMGTLVDRMDSEEPQLYVHLHICLENLLATGKNGNSLIGCVRTPVKDEMPAVKARWKTFLKDQGQALRNGKRFAQGSAEFRWAIYGSQGDEP